LRAVRVVLGVPELDQSFIGLDVLISACRGGVVAQQFGLEVVDSQNVAVEVAFEKAEEVALAEAREEVGEAIVVEVGWADGLAQQSRENALVLFNPGLDVTEAVVGLGQDVKQPDPKDLPGG
jgi:hypothetical protein